jgi:hypothetical protein
MTSVTFLLKDNPFGVDAGDTRISRLMIEIAAEAYDVRALALAREGSTTVPPVPLTTIPSPSRGAMTALLKGLPPSTMGRAVGFFFAFASVGWTVIPMLIGAVTRRSDIRKGFLVAAGSGAVFMALVIVRGLTAT